MTQFSNHLVHLKNATTISIDFKIYVFYYVEADKTRRQCLGLSSPSQGHGSNAYVFIVLGYLLAGNYGNKYIGRSYKLLYGQPYLETDPGLVLRNVFQVTNSFRKRSVLI